ARTVHGRVPSRSAATIQARGRRPHPTQPGAPRNLTPAGGYDILPMARGRRAPTLRTSDTELRTGWECWMSRQSTYAPTTDQLVVEVFARDIEASRRFYQQLGFELLEDRGDFVT